MDSSLNKQFRWPSFFQWTQLHRVLTRREKFIFPVLILVFAVSSFSLAKGLYLTNTSVIPKKGGSVTEGVVGSPRFLNPVYADTNDVDRDLIQLIYSGIMRYNSQGELVLDLAKTDPEITEGGRTITITLKENVTWHDGTPFGVNDIAFTIATIQDPAYKSPIRANWIGVEVEKVSDVMVRFHLLDPYAPFLERLTLKILPAHIWKDITPENFTLTPFNLQPVGTGPYSVTKIDQARSGFVREIRLQAFEGYHNQSPFIESLSFRFFNTEEEVIREANRGTIQSFSLAKVDNIQRMRNPAFSLYSFSLPRYFALFFNLDPPVNQKQLKERAVRQALSLALDKAELVAKVFQGDARVVDSPLLPDIFGFQESEVMHPPARDQEKALALLEQVGYAKNEGKIGKPKLTGEALTRDLAKGDTGEEVRLLQQCLAQDPVVYLEAIVNGNFGQLTQQAVIRFQEKYASEVLTPINLTKGTGKVGQLTREKLNILCFAGDNQTIPLTITIATQDQPPLKEVAEELKRQWEIFGLEVELQTFSPIALERDVIAPRAYQALLFGEALGTIPDPFPFWHSSQIKAPGFNFSAYNNRAVDRLLEDARKELDPMKRLELFTQMQELVLTDVPAVFLYDFDYKYFVSKEVRGIKTSVLADPSQRFSGIGEWYTKTKRAPK
ncbi:MAG: ABC transporter substrate-binding protein [Patescibacteria group bacterium]|mgnify:CR=1 FL=1